MFNVFDKFNKNKIRMTAETTENFKKNFNINTDISDITFDEIYVEPYTNALPRSHQFGEKKCLLYRVKLTIFNFKISFIILTFKYSDYLEILKLEIKIPDGQLSKEIAPCKNFLQRKRNMNSTLEILVKFTKLFEIRRLICLTVFQKQPNVFLKMDENGISVKCCKKYPTVIYLELNWSILWKVESYSVEDFIEFYINSSVFKEKKSDKIKSCLEILVEPDIDFHTKLKLWKCVLKEIYGPASSVSNLKKLSQKSGDVLEISDSDSDDSVIEVDQSIYYASSNDEIMVID